MTVVVADVLRGKVDPEDDECEGPEPGVDIVGGVGEVEVGVMGWTTASIVVCGACYPVTSMLL